MLNMRNNGRIYWIKRDSNEILTHDHLVRKRTLNHLVKLAKWLSCVVSTYLCGAFDCMLACGMLLNVSLKISVILKTFRSVFRTHSKQWSCFAKIYVWMGSKYAFAFTSKPFSNLRKRYIQDEQIFELIVCAFLPFV